MHKLPPSFPLEKREGACALFVQKTPEEKQFTKPTHVAVYLFRDLDRDRIRNL